MCNGVHIDLLVTMKYIIITIIATAAFTCKSQNVNSDSLCLVFNEQLTKSTTRSDSIRAYIYTIKRELHILEANVRDSINNALMESCPSANIVSRYNKTIEIQDDHDSIEKFKEQKASVAWTRNQLNTEIKFCQNHNLKKSTCKDAIIEASKHINYVDYMKLTDYQKGVVLSKASDILNE